MKRFILISIVFLVCCGCSSNTKSTGRYKLKQDKAPASKERVPNLSRIPNARPKAEARSRIGNPKTYKVFNKTYKVLASSRNIKERGKASWYGKKFHGYKTSNGDTYDMYSMTAAHKTLPLPTYLKVKNLKNGKVIVVKVNDRGPFHGDRIIDLSYAAAAKLGMLKTGTGDVEITAITTPITVQESYLQVGAFTQHESAKKLADRLKRHAKDHKIIIRKQGLYHVHVGPIYDETTMVQLKEHLMNNDFPEPMPVQLGTR